MNGTQRNRAEKECGAETKKRHETRNVQSAISLKI